MTLLLRKAPLFNDGVLVPIPQYPLYSATCTLLDGQLLPYYLDEGQGWAMGLPELTSQLAAARGKGVQVREEA
jgi:aspartate/methionine/tyrosine aminotransferase